MLIYIALIVTKKIQAKPIFSANLNAVSGLVSSNHLFGLSFSPALVFYNLHPEEILL